MLDLEEFCVELPNSAIDTYGFAAGHLKRLDVRSRMPTDSPEWTRYQKTVREFEAILEHAKAVSSSLVGTIPGEDHMSYGEQIFVKLLAHCVTMRRLAPDPYRRTPNELWDLPSMAAIARCAIEAHDAFLYIATGAITSEERDFRLRLWEFHDKTRRLRMLEAIGSKDPKTDEIRLESVRLFDEVRTHPFFVLVSAGVRRKVLDGDPPPFHLSQRERCDAFGINYDYYNAITMQLSQYVHSLPFSVHQLFSFRAGTSDVLPLMSLPMQFVLPFLSRVTDEMRLAFPEKAPRPPSRTAKTMALWRIISSQGVKRGV